MSGILRMMTVGVGGVCSVRVNSSCEPRHKDVPSPACVDWRGWFRVGFFFFLGDLRLKETVTPKLTHAKYPVTPDTAQRIDCTKKQHMTSRFCEVTSKDRLTMPQASEFILTCTIHLSSV
ncbi:hypothetical protein J6590_089251, partial [Homalodisca vitripennis]